MTLVACLHQAILLVDMYRITIYSGEALEVRLDHESGGPDRRAYPLVDSRRVVLSIGKLRGGHCILGLARSSPL